MKTFKIRTSQPCEKLYAVAEKFVKKDKDAEPEKVLAVVANVHHNSDGSTKKLPIDQFNGKYFLRNASGFPMNDIMAYEEAQNDSIARAVLSRISVIKQSPQIARSDQELFDTIVPANYSSPAEYLSICEKFGRLAFAKAEKIRADVAMKASARKAAAAKKAVNKVTANVDPE